MLQIQQLSKSYGTRVLFDDVTLALSPGERLGLVGRNGTGKTTLLRLILGQEAPDSGRLDTPKHYSIGHLSQHLEFTEPTVRQEACLGLPVQEGGWVEEYRAEEALMGLGFTVADFDRPPSEFSGGFQVRLQLAKVLVSQPNLLLLDEPTNYLDIVSMRWLERYLRSWDGEIILITHDRDFMDAVTTHTMVIHRGKIRRVKGNTAKLYEMLAVEEEIHEKTRINQAKSRRDTEKFIERFRYKASKARQVQSRIKLLEKQGELEQLEDIATLSFRFNAAPFHAHSLFRAEGLEFGYGDGPTLLEDLSIELEPGERVAIIGKNGKGKSTLLNLIADELKPRHGTFKRHPSLRLAHFGQTNIDRLHKGLTVEEEVMSVVPDHNRRTARGICGLMMFQGEDAEKPVDVLSGGERARVLLGKLLVSPANLVLLDEPTNHLDMESIESLIDAMLEFPGGVMIVTHNEHVLHALATKLVVFDRDRARWFDGTYQDFLDRVGWSDEDDGRRLRADAEEPAEVEAAPSTKKQGKEARKQRAAIAAERSKVLKPLAREVERLENAITGLEAELETASQALEKAAQQNDKDAIVEHSITTSDLQKRIDSLFEELETASRKHDDAEAEFERQLGESD
ncbi:MAG: ABC-F family ATP-binding cassette domain-containing protein [Planctomycetes bacterium]|nr:ABC-F family ATP-binding cassette domain-containing protein [Planctomycetota bacterium]